MSLVFVHGIGNRRGPKYARAVRLRDAYLRTFVAPVLGDPRGTSQVWNPFWGEAAPLRWNGASFPDGAGEWLGAAPETLLADAAGGMLLDTARRDLADAVDLLFSVLPLDELGDAELGEFVGEAAAVVAYTETLDAASAAEWLSALTDDAEFVRSLWQRAVPVDPSEQEVLGASTGRRIASLFADALRRGRQALTGQHVDRMVAAGRRWPGKPAASLLGEVFTYLATRGDNEHLGPAIHAVIADLAAARAADPARPLVVIAHSMGGNIVYDLLTSYRRDIEVDVLVTVGSQVGLFEELKLFRASDRTVPSATASLADPPPGVRHWLNVFDHADPLSYRAAPIFAGPVDYAYPSAMPWAHTAYFRQPYFYRRLAQRIEQVLP